jgi:enamine deaminase RidA (YjgF/YER057c/UK114 family)
VKIGNIIIVSGTTAIGEDGQIVGIDNPYKQTIYILRKIKKVIESAGGSLKNVVRTGLYVTNIEYWEEVGRAHGEYFKEIKPASTLVEVSKLIEPDILVEIEADAIIENQ